eukprot:14246906-Heterocapsa_arctica.AAC.1
MAARVYDPWRLCCTSHKVAPHSAAGEIPRVSVASWMLISAAAMASHPFSHLSNVTPWSRISAVPVMMMPAHFPDSLGCRGSLDSGRACRC